MLATNTIPSLKALRSLPRPILGDPSSNFGPFGLRAKASRFQQLLNANADVKGLFGDYICQKFDTSKQRKTKRRKGSKTKDPFPDEKALDNSALASVSEFLQTKIQPITLDVEVKGECGEPINMNVRIADTSFQAQYKLLGMTREESTAFTYSLRPHAEGDQKLLLCDELQPYISHSEKLDLNEALKQIRQFFERQWESESAGISQTIVECLETCERTFFLFRDQTTDSIWNVEHQEHRIEVFEDSQVGDWYRLKCICVEGALHGLDVYCPRNVSFDISDDDEELEWNEELQELVKKKAPRPTSPEDSDSDENEDDEEADRLAREKERAEIREKAKSEIREMVGLDDIKEHIQKLAARIGTSKRQGADLKEERFGTVLIGNPGTGYTSCFYWQFRY